ncbi:3'-5' exonuclease-like [Silene latifolia]|uniref:3'-5' exonuclease-like n=1 Tax=Silene latifolia TaxID=37657 RepID=UPI003D785D9E
MSGSITYNFWSDKYHVTFDGKIIETTVTKSASTINEWVNEITTATIWATLQVIGLDIEWRPYQIQSMSKTATLQLCVGTKCLIVQLFYVDYIPQSLHNFLSTSYFTFVGVGVANDAQKLKNDYGLECFRTDDVGAAAMQRWPDRFHYSGLKDLAFDLLGFRMDKSRRVTLSDWQAEVLSMDQIQYACIDAYASFRLGELLFN